MKKSKLKHTEQDSLHVVEFSQGRPNEISFNVLDKKSTAPSSGKRGFFSRFRSKNKGSYEGFGASMALGSGENTALKDALSQEARSGDQNDAVSSQTTRSSGKMQGKHAQPKRKRFGRGHEETPFLPNASGFSAEAYEEVARRQKRRMRSRIVSIALVIVVAAILAALAGMWLYQEYEKNRSNRELIDEACSYIEESDKTLVAIDEFFAQPFEDDTVERAEQLQAQIPSAVDALEKAKNYAIRADEAIEGTSADKEAAQSAYNAIVSRETMFELANEKLAIDIDAKRSMDGMNLIETNIDDAQYLLAQAAITVKQTSPETVAQSTEWLTEARTKLEEAQTALNEIIERFPDGDFTVYSEYLAKRLEEIGYGLLSNEAILIQDRKTAESNNELYNQADRDSVEIAKSFPETFAQPLVDAYSQASAQVDEQFVKLRSDVGGYDSFLRSYLGTETQKGSDG